MNRTCPVHHFFQRVHVDEIDMLVAFCKAFLRLKQWSARHAAILIYLWIATLIYKFYPIVIVKDVARSDLLEFGQLPLTDCSKKSLVAFFRWQRVDANSVKVGFMWVIAVQRQTEEGKSWGKSVWLGGRADCRLFTRSSVTCVATGRYWWNNTLRNWSHR